MSAGFQELVSAVGWSLVHFLWQGVVVACLLAVVLACATTASSRVRYLLRCVALAGMAVCPIVTFLLVWNSTGSPVPGGAGPMDRLPELPLADVALPWLVAVWFAGVVFLMVRLTGGCLEVRRLRRSARQGLPPEWQRRFEQLAARFCVRARACVVDSAAVAVPVVVGWFRPVVLLPARLFTGMTDEQVLALIAHELAHVRRLDAFVNLAQTVVESLLFYHPAVWWVSRGIRVEREFCCDDMAVQVTGGALPYARALADLERWRGRSLQLAPSSRGGKLMDRIQRLVGEPGAADRRMLRRSLPAAIALLVVTGLGGAAMAFGAGDGDTGDGPEVHRVRLRSGSGTQTLRLRRAAPREHAEESSATVERWVLLRDEPAEQRVRFVEVRDVRTAREGEGEEIWVLRAEPADASGEWITRWRTAADGSEGRATAPPARVKKRAHGEYRFGPGEADVRFTAPAEEKAKPKEALGLEFQGARQVQYFRKEPVAFRKGPATPGETTYEFFVRPEESDGGAIYEWVRSSDEPSAAGDTIELRVRRVADDQGQDLLELDAVFVEEPGESGSVRWKSVAPTHDPGECSEVEIATELHYHPRVEAPVAPVEYQLWFEGRPAGSYEVELAPQGAVQEVEQTLTYTPVTRFVRWSLREDAPEGHEGETQDISFDESGTATSFWRKRVEVVVPDGHGLPEPSEVESELQTEWVDGDVEVWVEFEADPAPPSKPRRAIAYF